MLLPMHLIIFFFIQMLWSDVIHLCLVWQPKEKFAQTGKRSRNWALFSQSGAVLGYGLRVFARIRVRHTGKRAKQLPYGETSQMPGYTTDVHLKMRDI